MTWPVRRLSSYSCSFTCRWQISYQINIRWVAIENPSISRTVSCYSTAIQRILVRSQIWQSEVKQQQKLQILRTDHVVIRSELKYSIWEVLGGNLEGPWNRPAVRVEPGQNTAGVCSVRGPNLPRKHKSGIWPHNKPNRTQPPVNTWTAVGLPESVGNTMFDSFPKETWRLLGIPAYHGDGIGAR